MIVLSTPTSLPPAFQPLVADDVRQAFPWDAFTTIQRDVTPPQAGPSTPRRQHDRPIRRGRAARSYTDEHEGNLHPESTDDENNSDDPDYLPTVDEPSPLASSSTKGKPRSQSKPRSRSQSRARETSTPTGVEKRYTCEEEGCGKSFGKPAKLKEHALSHTGERPFTCPHSTCTSSYTRLTHLQRHLLTHKDPDSKEFECQEEGCGKKFWTREKLKRHEMTHLAESGKGEGKGKRFDCPHCQSTFHKHTKLRTHVLDEHRDQLLAETRGSTPKRVVKKRQGKLASGEKKDKTVDEGEDEHEDEDANSEGNEDEGSEDGDAGRVRAVDEPRFRPFRCQVDGCEWTFETAQRLKMHGKVHQSKRYTCSHRDHTDSLPPFSRWSDLQAHIKMEHPPVCPYEACHGRAFKSNKNLREHVKVHIDRGDILGPNSSSSSRRSPSPVPTPGRTTRASSEAAVPRGRKRTRDPDYVDVNEESERHTKRLKRTESDVGKDWMCNEPECDKQFKTKRALAVHHSTAHLGLRPFACPHAECGNTYGHKHLLQRHIAARHRERSASVGPEIAAGPTPIPVADLPKFLVPPPATAKPEPSGGNVLTGMHALQKMANKALACPCTSVGHGTEGERCQQRFGRVYDVKRHVRKVHGLELSEREVRLMLGDVEGGDYVTEA